MGKLILRALGAVGEALDRRVGWDRLWLPLGLLTLAGLRDRLRQRNLYDTGLEQASADLLAKASDPRETSRRRVDGTLNDLREPRMGAVGARFGRNVPLPRTWPEEPGELFEPNPRTVSRELLTRDRLIPAETINVLAAAWLQFEVHDWFSHTTVDDDPWDVELAPEDPWPDKPMRIKRTVRTPPPKDGEPPTFLTDDSHWWDASQIYGSKEKFTQAIRADGGKLAIDETTRLIPEEIEKRLLDRDALKGVAGNFWVGLGVLHSLFMLEHNKICDALKANEARAWTDDELYETARLINAALMAKIHTVEWTPAIVNHPTTRHGMRANWWGLVGERFNRRFGRLTSSEALFGIPGSPTDHHAAPYSLTEEFVAVYRMHPLLPDHFTFRSAETNELLQERTFPEVNVEHTRACLEEIGLGNAAYSLGIANPGAVTLHNYPYFLQNLKRASGETVDLAATDILRIRERGVPRYNEFRRLFRLQPATSFAELTTNADWAAQMHGVYDGDVDRVDLMIGLYAEPPPKGFGFSDTAFRVFILMASRRLKSDRFFTRDYGPELYTRTGLEWINDNTMVDVLRRNFPELEPALRTVTNAFQPWPRVRS